MRGMGHEGSDRMHVVHTNHVVPFLLLFFVSTSGALLEH
jgi:hypothetical protein